MKHNYPLSHIVIKPTLICNMNCPNCSKRQQLYNDIKNDIKTKTMQYDDFVRIITEARQCYKSKVFIISGGEPLLYNRLFDLINVAKKLGYETIDIHTNASLLTPAITDKLLKIAGDILSFRISFGYANNRDFMLGRGVSNTKMYSNTIKNIKYLNNNKPSTTVTMQNVFLTTINLNSIGYLLHLNKILKFDKIMIDLLEGDFTGKRDPYRITETDAVIFFTKYFNLVPNIYKKDIKYLVETSIKTNYIQDKTVIDNCKNNNTFCIILNNGDLHMCNILEYSHEPCLNLYDYDLSITALRNSPEFDELIKNKSQYCNKCSTNIFRVFTND